VLLVSCYHTICDESTVRNGILSAIRRGTDDIRQSGCIIQRWPGVNWYWNERSHSNQ
jgi:hypothetical protein